MPRDLFAERGIKPPRDLFAERGISVPASKSEAPKSSSKSSGFDKAAQEITGGFQKAKEASQGAAQSFLNTPEQIAQVAGKHLYKPLDFAPKTEAAKKGAIGGDIASYFIPGGAIKTGLGALKYLPAAAKAIESADKGLKARPVVNFLLNMGKNVGEASLFQKAKNPESTPIDVAEAGGIGGLTSAAANAISNKNPIISTAAKLLTGGGIGYQQGGLPGAAEGATAMMVAPKMLSELGFGNTKIARNTGLGDTPIAAEMLSQEPNALAKSRYEAGKKIGAPVRPSEAFDNPPMAAREAAAGRTDAGGEVMAEASAKRVAEQKASINALLDKISPKTKENKMQFVSYTRKHLKIIYLLKK